MADWKRIAAGVASGGLTEAIPYAKEYLGYGPKTPPPGAAQGSEEDPNVAYQAAQNYGTRGDFLGRIGASDATNAGAVAGQTDLLGRLKTQSTNPNAPSVAGTMLAINNDRNASQALGNAAGVGGNNAFAARRQALQSIAQGNIGTAQNAALLRAKESADARTQEASVLNQVSSGANQRRGQDIGAATDFAGLASRGQSDQQGLTGKAEDETDRRNRDFFNKLFSGISSGGAVG